MDFVHYYDKLLSQINQVIRTFDTGISEGSVQEISLEEPGSSVPKEEAIYNRTGNERSMVFAIEAL